MMSRQPCATNPSTRNLSPLFLFPGAIFVAKPAARRPRQVPAHPGAGLTSGKDDRTESMARQSDDSGFARPETPASGRDDRNERIGNFLRDAYSDVLSEQVPDAFAELLRKLS
jgi:hypothetical protein